jgi:hypothetical protein
MTRKSDHPTPERRVSATVASRSFSRLLDEIEAGRQYLVHRRGQDVCVMAPPVPTDRLASECLARLRGRAGVVPDDRFGEDLLNILAGEAVEERPAWDS